MEGVIGIIFAVVVGLILYQIVRGIAQWHYNNQQPIRSIPARIVAKRTHKSSSVHTPPHGNDSMHIHHSTSTSYYITFECTDGNRLEFSVRGNHYGLLAEGDSGILTHQGTRYKSFERTIIPKKINEHQV